ncbi:MAG TPA: hypothetical protein VJI73_03660 [Candidatus Paceibacterota bacterium]
MDTMGAMEAGPMILGFNLVVFLMFLSGIFYLVCAAFLWGPVRREHNDLISALFAFLIYQAISMIFMGLEMYTMNILYSNIAAISIFVGSAYMLKFPFRSLSERSRRLIFLTSLIAVFALFAWFMQTEARQMSLMRFILWYDLAVNGIIVGGSMLVLAAKTAERWLRVKALGGGAGVVSCCVAASATMLSGAMLTSSVFQFLAPVFILGSLFVARRGQRQMVTNA